MLIEGVSVRHNVKRESPEVLAPGEKFQRLRIPDKETGEIGKRRA
jgi:hypothetical protein